MEENTATTAEVKSKGSFIGGFFKAIFKIIGAIVKAIVFAFVSVFKAFKDVFSRLDAKSLLSFLFLVVVIIAAAYLIGFNMGEKNKEQQIYDELGLTKEQVREFKDFLDEVNN